jgi:hypothetical protein
MKILSSIERLLLLGVILVLVLAFAGLFISGKISLSNPALVKNSFSQFIALQGEDEFVLARLVSNETFAWQGFRTIPLVNLPVGDTEVGLSLSAHYKYFIRFSELKHELRGDVLLVHAPGLYLSTPVAFELSSMQESSQTSGFGPDKKTLLQQLRNEASAELARKGRLAIPAVYDKAAKALADNINSYLMANGSGGYYSAIEVVFGNEKSLSRRHFAYDNSRCGLQPCTLEIPAGEGRFLIIH